MTRPAGWAIGAARGYYAVAGILASLVPTGTLVTSAAAALHGCQLVFSQAGFRIPPPTDAAGATPGCQQYIEVASPLVAAVLGVLLVATAIAVRRRRLSLPLTIAGGLAGLFVAVVPAWFVLWATQYYRIPVGPVELVIGGAPLIVAGTAAWGLWELNRLPAEPSSALSGHELASGKSVVRGSYPALLRRLLGLRP
jgi:hypothetical protein